MGFQPVGPRCELLLTNKSQRDEGIKARGEQTALAVALPRVAVRH